MSQTGVAIHPPRTDDRALWDIFLALRAYPAVLIAHEMKLFEQLAGRPHSLWEICAALGIARRPAEALLSVCTSLNLAILHNGYYSLTPTAEDYLLPSSQTYFGWFFEAFADTFSLESLRKAVSSDQPQGLYAEGGHTFAPWQAGRAVTFTRAMHSASIAPALAWPTRVDLADYFTMLDIGGGSGAHSIGAVTAWPQLSAVVLDAELVCKVAEGFISEYRLTKRIVTQAADFFEDPFPKADVHFYGMIFHDWPEEKCRLLARKSFDALDHRGLVVIHEMLFNESRTGPFAAAAFNVDMLVAMRGEQYSGAQIAEMLSDAGFANPEIEHTFGHWSIVTARKP